MTPFAQDHAGYIAASNFVQYSGIRNGNCRERALYGALADIMIHSPLPMGPSKEDREANFVRHVNRFYHKIGGRCLIHGVGSIDVVSMPWKP